MDDPVDAVFQRLVKGILPSIDAPLQSGWEAALPTGRVVTRSTLQAMAEGLAARGPAAIPALLKWANHENDAVRYLATFALGEITQFRPEIPHFQSSDASGERARAISAWAKWYEAWSARGRTEQ